MFTFLKNLVGGNMLLRVTSVNSVAIAVRVVAGLLTSKAVAFFIGPSGLALLGDLRNFLSSLHSIGTLGISNGIVKYSAQYKEKKEYIHTLISTSSILIFIASCFVAILLFFGASYWNQLIFNTQYDFTKGIRVLALIIPMHMINLYQLALLNGSGKYKSVIFSNIATNISGLLLTLVLIYTYTIDGALYALILTPAIALLFSSYYLLKEFNWLKLLKASNFNLKMVKKLASYTGMTLFSAMVAPWVYIAIRQEIIEVDGINQAGFWDGMQRISDYYMMFVTSVLTLYILPKFSAESSAKVFRNEVRNFYKTLLPIFIVGLFIIYLIRNWIIQLLFTSEFIAMSPIFKWQLLGDVFRVASFVIAYRFIAQNMLWHFIITQVLSLLIIYFSSVFFIHRYGFIGASMGHLVSYIVYWGVVALLFRKSLMGLND